LRHLASRIPHSFLAQGFQPPKDGSVTMQTIPFGIPALRIQWNTKLARRVNSRYMFSTPITLITLITRRRGGGYACD